MSCYTASSDCPPAQITFFRLNSLMPVLNHLNELMHLPGALGWSGGFSFELTAQSEMRCDGTLHLKSYLVLHSNNTEDIQEAASAHLRAWLRLLDVRYETLSHPLPLPSGDCRFIIKNARIAGCGYERIVLPLPLDHPISFEAVREQLLKHPGSGLSLHLLPTLWRNDEKVLAQRFALGSAVPAARWQELVNGEVFCFLCAVWGVNADLLVRSVTEDFAPRLTAAPELRSIGNAHEMIRRNPWHLHKLLCGRSRWNSLLPMSELMSLFECSPLRMGIADELNDDSSADLKKKIHQQEAFIEKLIARIDSLGTEHAQLMELFERQQLLSNSQLKELETTLAALTQERDELNTRLAQHTVHGAQQPLSKEILCLMGLEDEQQLLDMGMQQKHLSILRIAAVCLEGTPVLNHAAPPDNDVTDYHVNTLYLGFILEQMLHEYYHTSLYLPYYRACMGANSAAPRVDKTPLSHYDSGPEHTLYGKKIAGYRPIDWQSATMAKRFNEHVLIDGQKRSIQYWTAMFVRMSRVRETRNQLHRADMDKNTAYTYVHFLLKTTPALPCLLRMILDSERACANFPSFR